MPNWTIAVGLSLLIGIAAAWLLARWPMRLTWPVFILLPYLIFPEPDLSLAAFLASVAAVASTLAVVDARRAKASNLIRLLSPIALFVAFLGLYIATLAPDVLPADSGELQVVAANLGVAHPPGFPLYTMLAHLWTRLPLGTGAAYRVNLFSAVTSALTLLVVYLTVIRLSGRYALLAGWAAAIALGTATTFWSQATTANIRSLTGLFTALALYCLIRFGQSAGRTGAGESRDDRWLVAAALALGLGVTHHVSLVFLAFVGLVYVLLADRALWRTPRRWVSPILAGLVGLLPLLYLPLRANSGARGASPQLATIDGFLEHVLATGFRGDLFYFTEPAIFWERLRVMGNVLVFQFLPVLLLGMAVGFALLLWRDRRLAWLLGGTAAVFTLVAATYRAPQTVEYMMPAYVALALCLGYAVGNLPQAVRGDSLWLSAGSQLFGALMLVAAVSQGIRHYDSYATLHEDTTARDFAGQLLREGPPEAVILSHWHWVTPLWYLQEVEGQRPDVESRFVFPEGESYAETWARRVADAYGTGRPVITTFYDAAGLAELPIPEPIGEAYLFRQEPRLVLPTGFQPVALPLGDQVELLGYHLSAPTAEAGQAIVLTVAWRPLAQVPEPLTLFVHLVGPGGRVHGQDDVVASPQPDGLTLTQFRVVPRPGTPLETLDLEIGGYGAEPLVGESGEIRLPLAEADIEPAGQEPFTFQPLSRRLLDDSGRVLLGYDWDRTLPDQPRLYLHWSQDGGYWTEVRDTEFESGEIYDLPPYRGAWGIPDPFWYLPAYDEARHYVPFADGITWTGNTLSGKAYRPGQSFTIDQILHSDRPIARDYVVSTRLIGLESDGFHWDWWDLQDSIPGLGAVPTLKWIHGSRVLSPHRVTVEPTAGPGQQLTGALTLYDAFTNRPLPILDERITVENPWVPLGAAQVGE